MIYILKSIRSILILEFFSATRTKQAMKGGLSFYEALEHRLDLIQPTTEMVDAYLATHPPRFTPGIK